MKKKLKEYFDKYAKKDNLLILALLGILLMVIVTPAGEDGNRQEKITGFSDPAEEKEETAEGEYPYEEAMERQLKELLESMEGVGEVNVMITLASSEERIESASGRKTIMPKIEGVVVAARCGDDPGRIIEITDVIQSLFDVPIHKIRVVRMKSE